MTESENEDTGNIVNLSKAKDKREKTGQRAASPDKINKALVQQNILDIMAGRIVYGVDKAFPLEYGAFRLSEAGVGYAFKNPQGGLTFVDPDEVANHVVQYCQSRYRETNSLAWAISKKAAVSIADTFLACLPRQAPPRFIGQQSTEGPCIHRLPFNVTRSPDDAAWEKSRRFLQNLGGENWKALLKWLGSLFDEKTHTQQYVWIHGQGDDGKGTFINLLSRLFGSVFTVGSPPPSKGASPHWSSSLLHKRLVVFPDCNHTKFITSGIFKSLTGNDPLQVDLKFGKIFPHRFNIHTIIMSNNKPGVSGAHHDLRRIIYCNASTIARSEIIPNYENVLIEEAPALLGAALDAYEKAGKGRIVVAKSEELDSLVQENEAHYEALLAAWFEIDHTRTKYEPAAWARPWQIAMVLEKHFGSRYCTYLQQDFKKWLERVYNLRSERKYPREIRGFVIKNRADLDLRLCERENFDEMLDRSTGVTPVPEQAKKPISTEGT